MSKNIPDSCTRSQSAVMAYIHDATTTLTPFGVIPGNDDAPLFHVAPGVRGRFALAELQCLEDGALAILNDGIGNSTPDVSMLWVAEFALCAARALRESLGVQV